MAWETGTALGHYDLLERIRRACLGLGYGSYDHPTFAGTGNGSMAAIDTTTATVAETWTIVCTATAANGGTFSVTGSVSGAQGSATVGTPYSNSKLLLTINDGPTDFALNDVFTLVTRANTALPVLERWTTNLYNTGQADREWLFKAPGIAGGQEIFGGIKTYQDSGADYYNFKTAVFTGYVSSNTWETQPGASAVVSCPLTQIALQYWIVVNGQRLIVVTRVPFTGAQFEFFYLGKFLPYATPNQYPYPVIAAAMLDSNTATRYSVTTESVNRSPFKGASRANLKMRFVDGTYKSPKAWPYDNSLLAGETAGLRDSGGGYPVLPIVLYDDTPNIYGELDGVYLTTAFANAPENVITVSGVDYLVIPDVDRTGFNDYCAIKLA